MISFALEALPAPLGHVLHVGSGAAPPDWGDAGAVEVTFVEPDPDAVETLQASVGQSARVITAALTPGGRGKGEMYCFAFSELNSLHAPTELREFFPGLEERPPETVPLRDPAELVRGLNLPKESFNLLVLEAPGEGLAILKALEAEELLTCFGRIVVQEGRTPLYEGAAPFDEIEAWLQQRNFTGSFRETSDPDRPYLRADRDPRVEELKRLRGELEEAAHHRRELEDELEKLRCAQDRQREESEHLTAERNAEREGMRRERQALRTESETERRSRDAQLTQLREEMLKTVGQVELLRDLLLARDDL